MESVTDEVEKRAFHLISSPAKKNPLILPRQPIHNRERGIHDLHKRRSPRPLLLLLAQPGVELYVRGPAPGLHGWQPGRSSLVCVVEPLVCISIAAYRRECGRGMALRTVNERCQGDQIRSSGLPDAEPQSRGVADFV